MQPWAAALSLANITDSRDHFQVIPLQDPITAVIAHSMSLTVHVPAHPGVPEHGSVAIKPLQWRLIHQLSSSGLESETPNSPTQMIVNTLRTTNGIMQPKQRTAETCSGTEIGEHTCW